MLSKTHIAVGTASALTILLPRSLQELCPVVIGGIVGSIICDIDCKAQDSKDAMLGRAIAGIVSAGGLYCDMTNNGPISEYWSEGAIVAISLGAIVLLITGYIARESEHRFFSHSLLAFLLYGLGIYLCIRPVLVAFIIGFLSHLILDFLTYRPVQLLFPLKKGFSLKLWKSKSKANLIIMVLGYLWLIGICSYMIVFGFI